MTNVVVSVVAGLILLGYLLSAIVHTHHDQVRVRVLRAPPARPSSPGALKA